MPILADEVLVIERGSCWSCGKRHVTVYAVIERNERLAMGARNTRSTGTCWDCIFVIFKAVKSDQVKRIHARLADVEAVLNEGA